MQRAYVADERLAPNTKILTKREFWYIIILMDMKKVIVTGVTGGIGSEIAKKFIENGYFVIGQFNSQTEKAEELKNLYGAEKIELIKCDFSDLKSVDNFAFKICENHPKIDVLVNNAGFTKQGVFSDSDTDFLVKITNVNLLAPMILTREVSKNMISERSGSIVFVTSIWGVYGGSCEAAYSATKGGLIAFTKALGKELGLSSVRVNAVSCGFIDTPINSIISSEDKAAFLDGVALGRAGSPREVADSVYFLASNESSYVTASVLEVDGGF